jgi:putative transposase
MARLPRIIVPNVPHHVTQRGNRKQQTFFSETDYRFYLYHLRKLSEVYQVQIDAFCLMPNHVHLILTPPRQEALALLISDLHRTYTSYVNYKMGWKGHLWQGRYFSVALSPVHYETCLHYVEMNPVRANLVEDFRAYPWNSKNTTDYPFIHERIDLRAIREMTRTGRPQGDETFLDLVQEYTGYDPRRKKTGRPLKNS